MSAGPKPADEVIADVILDDGLVNWSGDHHATARHILAELDAAGWQVVQPQDIASAIGDDADPQLVGAELDAWNAATARAVNIARNWLTSTAGGDDA